MELIQATEVANIVVLFHILFDERQCYIYKNNLRLIFVSPTK